MLRWVYIEKNMPRDLSNLNATLHEGLLNYKFLGYLLLALGVGLFVTSFLKGKGLLFYAIGAMFLCMGYFLVHKAKQIVATRNDVFLNGTIVEAKVVGQTQRFNWLKLSNDYCLSLEVTTPKGGVEQLEIASFLKDIWLSNPVGSSIIGLAHERHFLFGEEISCTFRVSEP
jgi:hypothetical protein